MADTNPTQNPGEPAASQAAEPGTEKPNVRDMLLEGQNVEEPVEGGEPVTPTTDPAAPVEPTEPTTPAEPTGTAEPASPAESREESDESVESLTERLSQLGFEDVKSDQDGAERLLDAYVYSANQIAAMQEQVRQNEQMAQYGQLYLQQQQQQQQQAAQAQPEDAADKHWWAPPKFDPMSAEKYREIKVDESGVPTIDWKADTPPEVKVAAEQHAKYVEKWAEDLVQRPDQVLPPIIEREFDRLFNERFSAQQEQARVSQFANQVQETNAGWMYAHDPRSGGILRDQAGQPVLSVEGEQVMGFVEDAANNGVTDPERQWLYAVAMFDYMNNQRAAQQQQQQQQQQTSATQTAAQKRAALQRRGASGRNRGGSVAPTEVEPERAQDPTLSPGMQLLQQLKTDGADFV